MANKRFKYKASAVDQMIMIIILLACVIFGVLIYFDSTNKLPTNSQTSSAEVQELLNAQLELQGEIDRIKEEANQ